MKNQGMQQRVGFAWAGIAAAWRNERSFRIQIVFALALPVALLLLRVSAVWWALCVIAAMLVLAAELFNTALETLIDHLHPETHSVIKTVKDCAAGAVLLLSVGAVIVGTLTLLAAMGVLS